MSYYDLSNPLQAEQFKLRANRLFSQKTVVELSEKKPGRTIRQNKYLHLILAYFASECGCTAQWVKREYFKKLVNPETFIRESEDRFMGRVKYLRSSAELTTEEMTLAIERFRNWASQEAGIYIPSSDEPRLIRAMEVEVERNRKYL